MPGLFVISLDFELAWGVRGDLPPSYRANLLGVRQAIPAMLALFARHRVHATWATVGALFFDDRDALAAAYPDLLRPDPRGPRDQRARRLHLSAIGPDERTDPLHLARSLVLRIRDTPHQEIATHTFSHYECLAPGDHGRAFGADLDAALVAADGLGVRVESIVFPKNQYASQHLDICAAKGLRVFRGAAPGRLYRPRRRSEDRAWHRLGRLGRWRRCRRGGGLGVRRRRRGLGGASRLGRRRRRRRRRGVRWRCVRRLCWCGTSGRRRRARGGCVRCGVFR